MSTPQSATPQPVSGPHSQQPIPEPVWSSAVKRAHELGLSHPNLVLDEGRALIGSHVRYSPAAVGQIPQQWEQFSHAAGPLSCEADHTFGVSWNCANDGHFDYLCGVARRPGVAYPAEWIEVLLLPRSYAVFAHDGHVSELAAAIRLLWNQWVPASGLPVDFVAPSFERYSPEFNPVTGRGGMELWVPLTVGDDRL
jgi:AraC family transcriptional regulator